MHKNFSFKGLNRSSDIALAQDGECCDIVNLRTSNGSLLPMPAPAMLAELNGKYSALFWHEMADCYIAITNDIIKTLHFYKKDFTPILSGNAVLTIENLQLVTNVEFFGNFVCCFTECGIFYLIYMDGTYRGLGERPSIPDMNISVSSKLETLKTEETYYTMGTADELESTWSYNERGYIDECVSILNSSGYYVDRALFRVALRLYDGSYINISNIIYVSDETDADGVSRDAYNMISYASDTEIPSQYKVFVRGFKPDFSFDTSILSNWKNIVVGIDVFSTASIPGKKCALVGAATKFEMYTEKSLDELWNDIASAYLYYKVAEYDIDGNLLYRLDDVSPVNLALQQGLETMSVPSSLSSFDVQHSYVYNGRLHIASFREYFFKGYDAVAYMPVASGRSELDAMQVQVKIRTTQGDFTTEKYFVEPSLGDDGYTPVLPTMLTYPDTRAYEMDIYVRMGSVVYGKTFPLIAHKYLNIAYYLHKWYSPYSISVTADFANGGKPAAGVSDMQVLKMFGSAPGVYEVVYNVSRSCWMYKGAVFPPDEFKNLRIFAIHRNAVDGDKLIFAIKRNGASDLTFKDIYNIPVDETWKVFSEMPEVEFYPYEERRNVMKVSMVDNPFIFPAKCTYTPSQSGIIGLSSNTVALSQGQFGQFPLFVFCNDGIWAMSVDSSGSVAYLSSHQLSRDVCVNSHTICGVGVGVVFAGKRGFMLITGNSLKNISESMQGNDNQLTGVPDDVFKQISSLVSLKGNTADSDFQKNISNAFVAHMPAHNELFVCNSAEGLSYIYSFASAMWTRYDAVFMNKVKGTSTPHFIVPSGEKTAIYTIPDDISGDNRILIFTRPQIWGTKLPKRIIQLLLHAYLDTPEDVVSGMPLLGCYLLAGNDGVHFKLIAGCEKNTRIQDVLFPYFPTQSYKYYLFAIVGNWGKSSVITGFDVDIDVPWRNRLR